MSATARLPTTRWSLVIRAAAYPEEYETRETARRSLGELFQLYWPALFAYLQRRGYKDTDAEDLIQGFFADVMQRDSLGKVDQSRGRFRAFLYSSLDHYVANQHRHDNAKKRGGEQPTRSLDSLDEQDPDRQTDGEVVAGGSEDPSAVFDREWASCLIEQTLAQLREQYCDRGKERWFEQLSPTLTTTESHSIDRARIADDLKLSATALKVAIHRLRTEFRERLLDAVRETVDDPADCGKERQWLFEAFQRAQR